MVADVAQHDGRLRRNIRRKLYDIFGQIENRRNKRLILKYIGCLYIAERANAGGHQRVLAEHFLHRKPGAALQYGSGGAVGHFEELQNAGHRTHSVKVLGGRVFYVGIFLRQHGNEPVFLVSCIDGFDGLVAPHRNRNDDAGKQHCVFKCQNGQYLRDAFTVDRLFFVFNGDHGQEIAFFLYASVCQYFFKHCFVSIFIKLLSECVPEQMKPGRILPI